jgi:branched-chain amino acid aminotransferase
MTEPIAYLKGEFVPASKCVLPMHDLGIVLGAAVTDFIRTINSVPFRLDAHVERFYRSCKYARIEPPVDMVESIRITHTLLAENAKLSPGDELGLVFYMTAGENAIYAGAAGTAEKLTPTYVQHTFPLRFNLWSDNFLNGVHCVTPAPRHWPPACISSKIKNRNRLHMWIGEQEVKQLDPHVVPLYLDIHGNVTETGGSNFVIFRDNQIVSPRRNNILWGISLTVVQEIAAELGIEFVEEDIQSYDVINAEEAWLPSTPYCLAPVVRFNGEPIGDGRPGPMWRQVLDRWSELVGKDLYTETACARKSN